MLKFYLIAFLNLAILLAAQNIRAQDSTTLAKDTSHINAADSLSLKDLKDSVDALLVPKSYFQASITYLSNNVYLGRKDSAATPYITAMFGYYHKSGLYINASASYLPTAGVSRIDLVTLEAGYSFKAGNFDGQASAAKFWYNSESYNIKSELKGSISFFGSYDLGPIKPTLTPSLNIGNKLDYALTMGLEHIFYFFDDVLDITPTVNANASTQNYYSSYYRKRKFSVKRKKKVTIVKGSVSGVVEDADQFKMLDYEFTAPINYTVKKFTFNFSPVYAVPVNASLVTITTKIPNEADKVRTGTEKLGNSFFFQAGITYKF